MTIKKLKVGSITGEQVVIPEATIHVGPATVYLGEIEVGKVIKATLKMTANVEEAKTALEGLRDAMGRLTPDRPVLAYQGHQWTMSGTFSNFACGICGLTEEQEDRLSDEHQYNARMLCRQKFFEQTKSTVTTAPERTEDDVSRTPKKTRKIRIPE